MAGEKTRTTKPVVRATYSGVKDTGFGSPDAVVFGTIPVFSMMLASPAPT
jgi:hypothetical protein